MRAGHAAENECQLGHPVERVPVVANQQKRGQANQKGRHTLQHKTRMRSLAMAAGDGGFIAAENTLGLPILENSGLPPMAQLAVQPFALMIRNRPEVRSTHKSSKIFE